jgi:hypothetical protein
VAPASADGEPLFLVKPVELLAIEPDALPLQHEPKTTIAEPSAL